MQSRFFASGLVGLAFAAGAMVASPAFAEKVSYTADLTAADEVPPNDSKGTGKAEVTYDTDTMELKWKITFSGLSGPVTAAHFHAPAAVGQVGGIAVPIQGTSSPLEGSATLTAGKALDLADGRMYVNIHTAANKAGEIRGQVVKK